MLHLRPRHYLDRLFLNLCMFQPHGEPILGCPTGTAEFRQSYASAKVDASTAMVHLESPPLLRYSSYRLSGARTRASGHCYHWDP